VTVTPLSKVKKRKTKKKKKKKKKERPTEQMWCDIAEGL